MKIEEGMYVRSKGGFIDKIISFKSTITNEYVELEDEYYANKKDILKASHNIIDLIEVGDYVNGFYVYYCYCADEDSTGLFIDTGKGRQWLDKPRQIKSIVTKEQFESMQYKVGE